MVSKTGLNSQVVLNINATNLPQPIVFVNSQNRLPIAYILLSKDNHFEGKYLKENCYKKNSVDLFSWSCLKFADLAFIFRIFI